MCVFSCTSFALFEEYVWKGESKQVDTIMSDCEAVASRMALPKEHKEGA